MKDLIAEIMTIKFWALSVVLSLVLSILGNFMTDALKRHPWIKPGRENFNRIISWCGGVIIMLIVPLNSVKSLVDTICATVIYGVLHYYVDAFIAAHREPEYTLRMHFKIAAIGVGIVLLPLIGTLGTYYFMLPYLSNLIQQLGVFTRIVICLLFVIILQQVVWESLFYASRNIFSNDMILKLFTEEELSIADRIRSSSSTRTET